MQLEIEETALKKEKDDASKRRLEKLRKELAEAREQAHGHARTGRRRKARCGKTCASCARSSRPARLEMEKAERAYDLNKAPS
jgi:ATP-dependent Clp protease ATP-binding subunit ClpB